MKIGILTQPLVNNYGGILQNFALQQVVKSLGYKVETLNQDLLKLPIFIRILMAAKRLLCKYILRQDIRYIDAQTEIYVEFQKSNREIISFIKERISLVNIDFPIKKSFIRDNDIEAYIVGSDQVWRKEYTKWLYSYFLDFTRGKPVTRIAYAASFGVEKLDEKLYDIKKISSLLSEFKAISVREYSGVDICSRQLNKKVELVLDPTMLLSKSEYINLLQLRTIHQRYLAVYILDDTEEKQNVVKKMGELYNLEIRYAGRYNANESPSIESWLETIMNAEYVVTDSFHGTVFSVIFEKEFITLANGDRGITRINSLFQMLGLPETRLMSSDQMPNEKLESIDYEHLNKRLLDLRYKSLNFLRRSLQ